MEKANPMRARRVTTPPSQISSLVASALGEEPSEWYAPHTGLSSAKRFLARFTDGSSVFVKVAVDDRTEQQLRIEREILCGVSGDFVPREVAWLDTGDRPVLLVEDLSAAHWPADELPVTWKSGQFQLLFETLQRVSNAVPPESLPDARSDFEPQWPTIAREADRFLAMGLCSEAWFRGAIDGLIEAEATVPLAGDSLVHSDVRSDNLCFLGERVVLVDWGGSLRGHHHHDLATALTTLPLEGGPDPFDVLAEGGAWAAYHAGRNARRSYLPSAGLNREEAPEWFRKVLLRISTICLSWAAQSLDLPRWEGKHWRDIR